MNDTNRDPNTSGPKADNRAVTVMQCTDIQKLLTSYMTRELGESQSAFVREHLRKCADCQQAAKEIQATYDLLRSAGTSREGVPDHLSDRHRARIRRAYVHPFIGWIEVNHAIVSVIVATTLIVLILAALFLVTMLVREDEYEIIPIHMVVPEPTTLDAIPEPPGLAELLEPPDQQPAPGPGIQPPVKPPAPTQPARMPLSKRMLTNLSRNRIIGIGILVLAVLAVLFFAILVRRTGRKGDTESDGATEDGPPPFE